MSETVDLSHRIPIGLRLDVGVEELLDTVAWATIRDRRLLAVRSHGRDAFYLPGGKLEPGESPEAALCREVLEELGVVLDPLTVRPFAAFTGPAHGLGRPVTVRMLVLLAGAVGDPRPGQEVAELAWLTSAERHRCAPVACLVIERFAAEGFID
jgi:8-oxo-dGTP diphosphatase